MRIVLGPIMLEAYCLLDSIEAKSWSRSAASADRLLKLLPSPCWAETAPGCAIYYGDEQEATRRTNHLRLQAMNWMMRFCDPTISQEADDDWPTPARLDLAVTSLAEMNQNASTSTKTAPVES
jgi:hypothetical protein